MKLLVCLPSGLRVEFDGPASDLDRAGALLAALGVQRPFEAPAAPELLPLMPALEPVPAFEPFPDPPPAATDDATSLSAPTPSGRGPELIAAIQALGECTTGQISEHVGGASAQTIGKSLARLRERGLVEHNGLRGPAARWRPINFTPPATRDLPTTPKVIGKARREQAEQERDQRLHDGILALIAEHGPVSPAWISDQLVKNRREVAAVMREMDRCGLLEASDEGCYALPDQEQLAA